MSIQYQHDNSGETLPPLYFVEKLVSYHFLYVHWGHPVVSESEMYRLVHRPSEEASAPPISLALLNGIMFTASAVSTHPIRPSDSL